MVWKDLVWWSRPLRMVSYGGSNLRNGTRLFWWSEWTIWILSAPFRGEVPQGKSNCGGCIRLSLATLWISAPNTNFSLGSIDVQPHKWSGSNPTKMYNLKISASIALRPCIGKHLFFMFLNVIYVIWCFNDNTLFYTTSWQVMLSLPRLYLFPLVQSTVGCYFCCNDHLDQFWFGDRLTDMLLTFKWTNILYFMTLAVSIRPWAPM